MKITKSWMRPGRGDIFSKMLRKRGDRAYVTYFADDNFGTGAGSTAAEAVRDLRNQRAMRAHWGLGQ